MFNKVEIDGVEVSISELDAAGGQTQWSEGEHTVKYILKDPTLIGAEADNQMEIPTKIGAIFFNCSDIISVEIPNSVTNVGFRAFSGCTGLTSVTIPNSVTSIGGYAFLGCTGLTSVTIPNSVTSIGDAAFGWCDNLTSVTIPNSITSIGSNAFCGTNLDTTTQAQITAINENGICEQLPPR